MNEIGVKSTATAKISQAIRGGSIDVVAIRTEGRPPDGGRSQHTRADIFGDFSDQPAPAALIADAYPLAAANLAFLGVTGMNAQGWMSFFVAQGFDVGKSRTD